MIERHGQAPTSPYLHLGTFLQLFSTQRTAAKQSNNITISPSTSSRRPANIPLRTLSAAGASYSDSPSASLLASHSDEKQGRRSSLSRSSSPDSEFSWSDTGDLAEQLGEAEDPLQIKLQDTLDDQGLGASSRRPLRHKKVRYQNDSGDAGRKEYQPGPRKEQIEIPKPGPRYITRAEHIIAAAMSGGERQMHGLTGKPLV